jgi:hypothetical protein
VTFGKQRWEREKFTADTPVALKWICVGGNRASAAPQQE